MVTPVQRPVVVTAKAWMCFKRAVFTASAHGARLVGRGGGPGSVRFGGPVRIFLSYRRGDAGGYTGRLTDVLQQRLSPKSVFQDVIAIGPGEDYTAAIDRALSDCDAVLVVIGPAGSMRQPSMAPAACWSPTIMCALSWQGH